MAKINPNSDNPHGVYTPEDMANKYTVGVDFADKPDITVHVVITKRDGSGEQEKQGENEGKTEGKQWK